MWWPKPCAWGISVRLKLPDFWTALWFRWDMKRPLKWRQKHNKLSMVYGLPMFCLEKVIMSYQFLLRQDFQDGLASRRPQIHHIMDGTPPRVRSLMPRTTSSTHGWRNVITTSGLAFIRCICRLGRSGLRRRKEPTDFG